MNKSTTTILIYIIGLIFGAFVLDLWSANTGPKAFMGIIWTALLLISLLYTDKHEKNDFKIKLLIVIFFFIFSKTVAHSEIMFLRECKNLNDSFIKNEYILDFEKLLMTRNYIYDGKTYKKYKLTDLSIKKENSLEKFIYEDNGLILTDKVGYPQFYTQLVFERNNPIINIKTVINNEESLSKISTCNKVELFEKES